MKLKKFEDGLPKDVIRELEALRLLAAQDERIGEISHVIELLQVFTSKGSVVFVYECMEADLHRILAKLVKPLAPA